MSNIPTLQTVNQFSEEHNAFSQGSIRWLIFNEKDNGLSASGAIVRVGRKVMIDVDKFFLWIKSQQNNNP